MKNLEAHVNGARWKQSVNKFAIWATSIAAVGAIGTLAASCGNLREVEMTDEEADQLTATASFQNGALPTTAYAGTEDATLQQANPATNTGTATSCEADGDDGSGVDKSCIIKWALTGIPAGATVQSASVVLQITNSTANTYDLYGVLPNWNEAQATWQNATASTPWQTAGAMGAADRGASIGTVTGATGSRTITLNATGIALVQSWVNGGTNGGIIIANASNTDGIDFASSEHATIGSRPRLNITYVTSDGTGGTGGTGGAAGTGGAGGAGAGGTGGTGSVGGTGGTGGTNGSISTDSNLKIAFLGDTDTGSNFTSTLNLVKNEGAAAVVVEGDMSYSANPTAWWNALEGVLGTSFPVFISRGNHDDSSWSSYLPKAANHLGGATRTAGANDSNYKTTFRGLVIATIKKGDTAASINTMLQGDEHIWKICNWHQNQAAMQVGGKGDEMGWSVYDTCRQLGAIIETGHEHSYSRTKTLTVFSSQTVDSSCSSGGSLCVGVGRTFASVVGLGGQSMRSQTRCLPASPPYGCNGEWASIYTTNQTPSGASRYGAQFITFNAGSARTATGYFKNTLGETIDTFTITHD